jgi:hypothetical protein
VPPPTFEEVEIWRRWVEKVFQPMNVQMEKAIVDNAQLIEGGHIYPAFADLILHVESYKATIAKWNPADALQNPRYTDGSENLSFIEFPKGFDRCAALRFEAMRKRRAELKEAWLFWSAGADNNSFPEDCR